MIKSSSLLLVGTGILLFSLYSSVTVYYSIILADDYATTYQILSLVQDPSPENIQKNPDGVITILELGLGLLGIVIGVVLILFGGIKLVYEKKKYSEKNYGKKPVNIIWQVIGSAFPGFDLLVMYRIRKLRFGSVVYTSQFVVWSSIYLLKLEDDLQNIIGIFVGISYAIIVYIWSKKWNEHFLEKNITEKMK